MKRNFVIGLGFVEEPECRWQRDGVEHILRQCQHAVDEVFVYQGLANFRLRVTGVRSRVSHHKSSTAFRL